MWKLDCKLPHPSVLPTHSNVVEVKAHSDHLAVASGGPIHYPRLVTNIRSLTSLRFFAALAIVFSHVSSVTGMPFLAMRHVVLLQGVSLFFVLSGFILSVRYLSIAPKDKRSFYLFRLTRIYPVYFVAILCAAAVNLLIYRNGLLHYDSIWLGTIAEFVLVQSWLPQVFPMNGVDWSISTEMFFYLCFPYVRNSKRLFWTLVASSAGFVAIICVLSQPIGFAAGFGVNSFFRFMNPNPLARMPEFLAGVWLGAKFVSRRIALPHGVQEWRNRIAWSGAEFTAVAVCWQLSRLSYGFVMQPASQAFGGDALQMVILTAGAAPGFGLLIWVLAHERGVLSHAMHWRPLVYLGEVSFSLYLFHEMIFDGLKNDNALPDFGVLLWPQGLLVSIGLLTSMILVACACHGLVERPAQSKLRSLRRQQIRHPAKSWSPTLIDTELTPAARLRGR